LGNDIRGIGSEHIRFRHVRISDEYRLIHQHSVFMSYIYIYFWK